ncbi:hypothetical protein EVAR_38680_1 [Eumeta japonica]|uniref:Uncharacterized protein n=1 Tax=Eumeta variegata TaxID=151549 RepID=A0A4C1YAE4_EUMVA|nr:hypothetical protein EVAR_38680_1 [Eumeta japonica]
MISGEESRAGSGKESMMWLGSKLRIKSGGQTIYDSLVIKTVTSQFRNSDGHYNRAAEAGARSTASPANRSIADARRSKVHLQQIWVRPPRTRANLGYLMIVLCRCLLVMVVFTILQVHATSQEESSEIENSTEVSVVSVATSSSAEIQEGSGEDPQDPEPITREKNETREALKSDGSEHDPYLGNPSESRLRDIDITTIGLPTADGSRSWAP